MKIKSVTPLNDGMSESKAADLWDNIEGFAAYSFNKSHSYEYSLISWTTMWIKVHYPAEFYAAAMTVIDNDEKLASLVMDAQSHKLQILPPDLNKSSNRIEIEGEDKLYAPFQAVKGISANTAAAIVKLRDTNHPGITKTPGRFTMLSAATTRAVTRGKAAGTIEAVPAVIDNLDPTVQKAVLGRSLVNAKAVENLGKVGAFHSVTGEGRPPMHPERLKDRIELMPGFTVELVKPDRGLSIESLHQVKIVRMMEEARACDACSLKGRGHPMPAIGKKAKFMVVFDTPGWKEEQAGRMLAGDSGDVIKAALAEIGLTANDGYYTSLVKSPKPKEQKALTNENINGCEKFLKQELDILKPPVIIAMGSNAVRWFSPGIKGTPADLAGKAIYRADLDATIIFGLNPGSLFHDPSKITLVQAAFRKLGELLA